MANTKQQKIFNIVTWNANGLYDRKYEFEEFLHRYEIDIALISETHLHGERSVNIKNYYYRKDRPNGAYGGVAIYIKNNIPHHVGPD